MKHGTVSGYTNHRCRCEPCKRARSVYDKRWRLARIGGVELLVDSAGTRRRLQALAVVGWSADELAPRLGVAPSMILHWRTSTSRMRKPTADAVRALYDDLWDQPGPSSRAAATARGKGWAPPLAWDDDEIDKPDAQPHAPEDRRAPKDGTPTDYVVEDFLHTYAEHGGDVAIAARRLGMTTPALSRALYRARRRGLHITFTDTKKGAA